MPQLNKQQEPKWNWQIVAGAFVLVFTALTALPGILWFRDDLDSRGYSLGYVVLWGITIAAVAIVWGEHQLRKQILAHCEEKCSDAEQRAADAMNERKLYLQRVNRAFQPRLSVRTVDTQVLLERERGDKGVFARVVRLEIKNIGKRPVVGCTVRLCNCFAIESPADIQLNAIMQPIYLRWSDTKERERDIEPSATRTVDVAALYLHEQLGQFYFLAANEDDRMCFASKDPQQIDIEIDFRDQIETTMVSCVLGVIKMPTGNYDIVMKLLEDLIGPDGELDDVTTREQYIPDPPKHDQ